MLSFDKEQLNLLPCIDVSGRFCSHFSCVYEQENTTESLLDETKVKIEYVKLWKMRGGVQFFFPEIWQRSDADVGKYYHPVCEDACLKRALNSSVNYNNNHNGNVSEFSTLTPLTRRQRPNKQFRFCAATHVHVFISICNFEWFVYGIFLRRHKTGWVGQSYS